MAFNCEDVISEYYSNKEDICTRSEPKGHRSKSSARSDHKHIYKDVIEMDVDDQYIVASTCEICGKVRSRRYVSKEDYKVDQ